MRLLSMLLHVHLLRRPIIVLIHGWRHLIAEPVLIGSIIHIHLPIHTERLRRIKLRCSAQILTKILARHIRRLVHASGHLVVEAWRHVVHGSGRSLVRATACILTRHHIVELLRRHSLIVLTIGRYHRILVKITATKLVAELARKIVLLLETRRPKHV